jgi:hypothetical protein
MAKVLRIDPTNIERSRRARQREREGRKSLSIEPRQVELVRMLIDQDLLPENLEDDKAAIEAATTTLLDKLPEMLELLRLLLSERDNNND